MVYVEKCPNLMSAYHVFSTVPQILYRFLFVEALVGAFNKDDGLVEDFSEHCEIFTKVRCQLKSRVPKLSCSCYLGHQAGVLP